MGSAGAAIRVVAVGQVGALVAACGGGVTLVGAVVSIGRGGVRFRGGGGAGMMGEEEAGEVDRLLLLLRVMARVGAREDSLLLLLLSAVVLWLQLWLRLLMHQAPAGRLLVLLRTKLTGTSASISSGSTSSNDGRPLRGQQARGLILHGLLFATGHCARCCSMPHALVQLLSIAIV